MATTDHPPAEDADAVSAVTDAVGDAELVHLVAYPDGDCLAAAGLLAAACDAVDRPYHVGVATTAADLADRLGDVDATATTVLLGAQATEAVALDPDGPVSPLAFETAAALGADPSPITALAGVVAAGGVPSRMASGLLEAAGLDRTPGVAVPTGDLADGLAHTTLVHAPFSGDAAAAREALAPVGLAEADATTCSEGEARRAASLLALAAGASPDATPRAATAVERALRPYRTDGPFATLGGYADVLSALAERAPGLAITMAAGADGRAAALDAWREHGKAAHEAVRTAGTARYHGVVIARTDGALAAVARLLRDYRSPEPIVLAVGPGEAVAAGVEPSVDAPLAAAADEAGGSSLARRTTGVATFDPDRTERFVEAFREALP